MYIYVFYYSYHLNRPKTKPILHEKHTENSDIALNISELKLLESVLNQSETWIWVVDSDSGIVLFANTPAQRDFGMYRGSNCFDVMSKIIPQNCENCHKDKIHKLPERKIQSTMFDPRTSKWFRKSESTINWKNSPKAKLSVWVDISETVIAKNDLQFALESQAKLIESLPNIVWRAKTDNEGRIFDTYISPAVDKLLNVEQGTINSNFDKYFTFVHPEDLKTVLAVIRCATQNKTHESVEYRMICGDGKIIWVYSLGAVYHQTNLYSEIYGSTSNITNIKNKEAELRESENRYFELFNNLPIPSIIHQKGIVFDINRAALNFIGAEKREDIIGKNAMDFVDINFKELAAARIKKILTENTPVELVHEKYITLTGETKDVETTAVPFTFQGELYIQVAFYDITNRKKDEQSLRENQTLLAELNATKDKFFSLIAHDLKNPFHQIMGFTELLTDNEDNYDREQTQSILQYIGVAANSAYKLLENLLQWSRAQTGRMDFCPEKLSVFDTLMSVIDLNQAACKRKEIAISQNIEPNTFIFADREMTEGIVRNLLSNAIKFSHRKGRIIVSAYSKKQEIIITVQDFGVGMTQEQIDKLYKIDQSQSTSGTEDEPGTGLGLILCKEFVRKNKGQLWVDSLPGKGCVFYLALPCSVS